MREIYLDPNGFIVNIRPDGVYYPIEVTTIPDLLRRMQNQSMVYAELTEDYPSVRVETKGEGGSKSHPGKRI